jgi:hypothetical protein
LKLFPALVAVLAVVLAVTLLLIFLVEQVAALQPLE